MQSAAHILNSTEFWQAQTDASKYIKHRFQDYGYRLAVKLGDLPHRSVYMRLAKTENQMVLETALRFALDFDKQVNKGRLFMWKLKQIRAEQELVAAKQNLDPEFVMSYMRGVHDTLAGLLHMRHQQYMNNERISLLQDFAQRVVTVPRTGKNVKLLNWGTATGVDAKFFANLGIKVTGVDQSRECINLAKQQVAVAKFIAKPDIRAYTPKPQTFHGIWAGTIWNTLPHKVAHDVFAKLVAALAPQGVLGVITHTGDNQSQWKEFTHQDQPCLYFDCLHNAQQLQELATANGMVLCVQQSLGEAQAWLWKRLV